MILSEKSATFRDHALGAAALRTHTASGVQRRKYVPAVIVEPQGLRPADRRQRQRPIEVRKQRTAARTFPFQCGAQFLGPDRHQNEARHSSEMFGRRAGNLRGGGEMNVTISEDRPPSRGTRRCAWPASI